jgi:hypothetical protein
LRTIYHRPHRGFIAYFEGVVDVTGQGSEYPTLSSWHTADQVPHDQSSRSFGDNESQVHLTDWDASISLTSNAFPTALQ